MHFGQWSNDVHDQPEQIKRIQSAKSSKTTPSEVNQEKQSGVFPGSGVSPYHVTLDSCTCGDFTRRRLPCKHIYRLAIELGLTDEVAIKGVNKNSEFSLGEAIAIIENYEEGTQLLIKDILYKSITGATSFPILSSPESDPLINCPLFSAAPSPEAVFSVLKRRDIISILDENGISGFKRNLSVNNLALWIHENVPDVAALFPKAYLFSFSARFQRSQRRTYSYLLRKYDWDVAYNDDMQLFKYPHGSEPKDMVLTLSADNNGICSSFGGNPHMYFFPDDEITKLLTLYGCNRCADGFDITSNAASVDMQ